MEIGKRYRIWFNKPLEGTLIEIKTVRGITVYAIAVNNDGDTEVINVTEDRILAKL